MNLLIGDSLSLISISSRYKCRKHLFLLNFSGILFQICFIIFLILWCDRCYLVSQKIVMHVSVIL